MDGLEWNWAALALAIIRKVSPEDAFVILERGLRPGQHIKRPDITEEDDREIYRLHAVEKVNFTVLAEMYGTTRGTVKGRYAKVKRQIEKEA